MRIALTSLVTLVLVAAGPSAAIAKEEQPSGELHRPDAASATALATQVNEPVRVDEMTTETSDTTAMPDGSYETRTYPDPVRVRRGATWAELDMTLRQNPDGTVSPVAAVSDLRFSGGGSDAAVRLSNDGRELALTWPSALPVPVVSGDTATYQNVFPGVDLQLSARADGFAQYFIVKTASGAAQSGLQTIRWNVAVQGLSVADDGGGRLSVTDTGTGDTVWVAGESYMWDSSGPSGSDAKEGSRDAADGSMGVRSARIGVTVSASQINITPDTAMLADPQVEYPIIIDPELISYSSGWTQVNSGAANTSYWGSHRDSMRVGLEWNTTCCVWRSMVRFGIGSIVNQNQQILEAEFRTLLDHSAACSPTAVELWFTDWLNKGQPYTWNNTNSFGASGFWNNWLGTIQGNANESGSFCAAQPDMWMEWGGSGLRDIIQGSANGTCGCIAFGLKAAVENDDTKWKRFYPADITNVSQKTYLWIKHDRVPNMPVVQPFSGGECYQACASPAVVRTTTPSLPATVSDPDLNSVLHTKFEVRVAPSDTAGLVVDNAAALVQNASGQTPRWPVPAGKLVNNTTYHWRAQTRDELGLWGGWTPWQSLTIDTSGAPVSDVTSSLYPRKKWGAQVGTSGTFSVTAPVDVREFTWWLDGGSQTTVTASGTDPKTTTITLNPATDMVHVLHVTAKDVAGNVSATFDHEFWVSPVPTRCWLWRLDETAGATAAESGKAACTPTNATVTAVPAALTGSYSWTGGHIGNGVNLSGGWASAGQPVIDGNKSFTVTAWVKPTSLASGDQTMVSLDGTSTSRFQLNYDAQANSGTGGWCFTMRATDSTSATPVSACATGTVPDDLGLVHPPTNNSWVHLAGVYNAATGKLQIHVMGNPASCFGEMVDSNFSGTWPTFNSLAIGRATSGGASSEVFRGVLDEIRAYPIALSSTVICQLANQ